MPEEEPAAYIEAQAFDLDDQTLYLKTLPSALAKRYGSRGDPSLDEEAPGFSLQRAEIRRGSGYSGWGHYERPETSGDVKLKVRDPDTGETALTGRAVVCRAFAGQAWSVSLRRETKGKAAMDYRDYSQPWADAPVTLEHLKQQGDAFPIRHWFDNGGPNEEYFNSIGQQGDLLKDCIFGDDDRAEDDDDGVRRIEDKTGLVVITGGTGSGKSQILRHIIFSVLSDFQQDWVKAAHEALSKPKPETKRRRPHFVTFEDPIESYFLSANPADKGSATGSERTLGYCSLASSKLWTLAPRFGIDYTPRERGKDALTLKQALRDALRQKPAVFLVGETREPEDWRDLLEFAGSGHLVFTTAHASSLTEAVSRILRAANANTTEKRAEVANRLLGVVHIQRTEVLAGNSLRATVPAVWRQTPAGVKALVAEGLSSILPNTRGGDDIQVNSFGRFYFCERLIEKRNQALPDCNGAGTERLMTTCREWDMEGR